MWKELGDAVVMATNRPGYTYTIGPLKVRRDGAWLRIRLPSGRFLCYPSPQVSKDGTWSYMGVNQYNRKWSRIKSYGGKIFENICQGVARDVMAYNMPDIEAAGYEIDLTVHDELVTETPNDDRYSPDGLSELLARNCEWSEGLPLAAAGFEALRYRKD
jgi:DNA polymerase